jgi:hypothetical protein
MVTEMTIRCGIVKLKTQHAYINWCFLMLIVVVWLSASSMALSQGTANRRWIMFSPTTGDFSVELPLKPEHEVSTIKSKQGPMSRDIYTVEDGGFIFTIACVDLPQSLTRGNRAQGTLVKMQEELLKQIGATKTSEAAFQVNDYSGREIRFDLAGGQGRTRLVLVKRRLYQLLVTRLDAITKREDPMTRFLESFKLLGPLSATPRTE